jgi:hypothetical protein
MNIRCDCLSRIVTSTRQVRYQRYAAGRPNPKPTRMSTARCWPPRGCGEEGPLGSGLAESAVRPVIVVAVLELAARPTPQRSPPSVWSACSAMKLERWEGRCSSRCSASICAPNWSSCSWSPSCSPARRARPRRRREPGTAGRRRGARGRRRARRSRRRPAGLGAGAVASRVGEGTSLRCPCSAPREWCSSTDPPAVTATSRPSSVEASTPPTGRTAWRTSAALMDADMHILTTGRSARRST